MRAHERRLFEKVDAMLKICIDRGITAYQLRQWVHDTVCGNTHVDSTSYQGLWEFADGVSRAGVAAQISYLVQAWGCSKLERRLMALGGALDAIVLQVETSPEELRARYSPSALDGDGDVEFD